MEALLYDANKLRGDGISFESYSWNFILVYVTAHDLSVHKPDVPVFGYSASGTHVTRVGKKSDDCVKGLSILLIRL